MLTSKNLDFTGRIGVEIETTSAAFFERDEPCYSRNSRPSICSYWLSRCWESKYDGSLPDDGVEFVSRPLAKEEASYWIEKLLVFLRNNDAASGEEAGVHIHIGVEQFGDEEFSNLLRILYKVQIPLYRLGGLDRIFNRYCDLSTWVDLFFMDKSTRYRGINFLSLKKHGTIEFRLHEGTLNEERIANFSLLCWELCQCAWLGIELPEEEEDAEEYLLRILSPDLSEWARDVFESLDTRTQALNKSLVALTVAALDRKCTEKLIEEFDKTWDAFVNGEVDDLYAELETALREDRNYDAIQLTYNLEPGEYPTTVETLLYIDSNIWIGTFFTALGSASTQVILEVLPRLQQRTNINWVRAMLRYRDVAVK